ncbi:MAG: GntR family transcriptional regulator [Planctomycetia bacterium]
MLAVAHAATTLDRSRPLQNLLSQRVYRQLYDAMLDHRLRPGDRLNRRQVAQDLGVSVAPVLEAMVQLEWEGFLATSPRVGTIVRGVTLADVLGKFRLRQAIEVEAARLYAGERIRDARRAVEPLAERADAAETGTLANYRTEVEFHMALVKLADCQALNEEFSHVMRHSLYHAAHDLLPILPERTPQMHTKLIAAMCRADAATADRLIRSHLGPWVDALSRAVSAIGEPASIAVTRGNAVRIASKKTAASRRARSRRPTA